MLLLFLIVALFCGKRTPALSPYYCIVSRGRRQLLSCAWMGAYVTYVPVMSMTEVDRGMANRLQKLSGEGKPGL